MKYFNKTHPENLLNIFTKDEDSYIKISITDEPDVFYVLDKDGTHIEGETSKTDDVFVGLNNSSDFISHRLLINFYNYRNSKEINLWPVFNRDILPFLKTDRGFGNKTLNTLYNEIVETKPYKIEGKTIKTTTPTFEYLNSIEKFNNDLKYWIAEINTDVNKFYEKYFHSKREKKLKIRINLKEELKYFNIVQKRKKDNVEYVFKSNIKDIIDPIIKLSISVKTESGHYKEIDRPQSYLNEAKLTAIALSVRFVLLKNTIRPPFKGRILFLDDLLISLDMSNREAVLDIIIKNILKDYQVIFLTHDRLFFHTVLNYIKTYHSNELKKSGEEDIQEIDIDNAYNEKWNILEMYSVLEKEPVIIQHKTNLQKAYYYFTENIDYNACGNYLRTSLEEFFREFIPEKYLKDDDGNPIDVKSLTLNPLIVKAISFFTDIRFSTDILNKLNTYREQSLNKTSHYNPNANYYKRELHNTFEIIETLKKYKIKPVIKVNEIIQFSISSVIGDIYEYKCKLLDDIRLYLEYNEGATSYYCDNDKRSYVIIDYTGKPEGQEDIIVRNKTLQELYYETFDGLQNIKIDEIFYPEGDIYEIIKNSEGKSLNELKEY